jgi:ABC-type polysaccharide/polyol phosphate transport system ATPase subunit
MGNHAIEVDHVSKRYRLGYQGMVDLRETVAGLGRRLRGGTSTSSEAADLWALSDVSFAVSEGEAIGVVGRNGAGKSTLLKVLARITEPTSGSSRTRGRVGSLLEVGTGFHGDLTGRENVFLNGAILGLSRRRIAAQLDAIVEFAGVERFLDTPVKRYSSGMYLRLAFAVAAHLDTEIMVVDEVLAVGDAEFQRKCLRRMSDVEAEGRSVVFVSHDLNAVATLCERVLWLDRGRVVADGPASEVLDAYLAAATGSSDDLDRFTIGDAPIRLERLAVRSATSGAAAIHQKGDPITVEFAYRIERPISPFQASVTVFDNRGRPLVEDYLPVSVDAVAGRVEGTMTLPGILNPGRYELTFWAGNRYQNLLDTDRSLAFDVVGEIAARFGQISAVSVPCAWDLSGPT